MARAVLDILPANLHEVLPLIPARIVGSAARDGVVRLVIEADDLPGSVCTVEVSYDLGRSVTARLRAVT